MITKQLLEHIEGEASVYFDIKDDKVDFATITFPHFRGMESILKGKNALDALVITPRVCGICGHAHLMAAVRAIEDAYKNAGFEIKLTQKAQKIREFTLIMEMIQNHFKWLYMVIIPELVKLISIKLEKTPLKGAYAASLSAKAIAVFGGQWPHSSYMIPGGVTSDPTFIEIMQARSQLEELIKFFEKETLGISLDKFLTLESCKDFNGFSSDLTNLEKGLIETGMHTKGFAKDQFIVLGEHGFTNSSKLKGTRTFGINSKYVSDTDAYSPQEITYAKNALYKNEYYEAGPLGRMLSQSVPLIKNMHRRYKDSAYSRVMARVFEIGYLLEYSKILLDNFDIDEDSVVTVTDIKQISATGIGVVEAPRGPLLHKIELKNGMISQYHITTPTQFNIGSSTPQTPTPVQQAMQGLAKKDALFIFRTFDVCSVCTTH
ncbi:nickel-dependent hydrogenase large subunit [Sulfurimonas paralvinellae]|uniref:Hydrogenase n=1 Tax=Sulfurimonas paralvinellae TaxID=317658 RepID=A0A7M1BAN9_9BACT|nr:nickel-dependent hydrogenase large subunit [Sulfurimonas paralvinellae]QOP46799.1 hydrogenase [Sulfurimonas paralvinellae]